MGIVTRRERVAQGRPLTFLELDENFESARRSGKEFNTSYSYDIGEVVLYNNGIHISNTDGTTIGVFNPSEWDEFVIIGTGSTASGQTLQQVTDLGNTTSNSLNITSDGRINFNGTTAFIGGLTGSTDDLIISGDLVQIRTTDELNIMVDGVERYYFNQIGFGINVSNPQKALDVNGIIRYRALSGVGNGLMYHDNNGDIHHYTGITLSELSYLSGLSENVQTYFNTNRGSVIAGSGLTWDGSQLVVTATTGGSSLWSENGTDIYYDSGEVLIGTSARTTSLGNLALHVDGNLEITNDLYIGNNDSINWYNSTGGVESILTLVSNDALIFGNTSGTIGKVYFRMDSSTIMVFEPGRVGINNTTPTEALDVIGTIKTDSHGDSSQWNTAYNERGSQIAGSGLTWNGSQLDVIGLGSGGTVGGSGVIGQIAFWDGTTSLAGSSSFTWDGFGLAIGTATTVSALTVNGGILTNNHGDSLQWNTAYNERGSQIAGSGLTWDGSQLVVNTSALTGINYWVKNGSVISYNDGFVGIGTSNPAQRLSVDGSINISGFYQATGTTFGRDSRLNNFITYSSDAVTNNRTLTIGNATYQNLILSSRFVAINTATTVSALTVNGGIWTNVHGNSSQWNAAYNERGSVIAGSGLTWDGSQLVLTATTGTIDGAGVSNQLAYWVDSNTITGNTKLIWNGTRLGVGGTPTNGLLDMINGTINFDNAYGLEWGGSNNRVLGVAGGTGGGYVYVWAGGSERLRINGDGNILIGTTTSTSALTVNGGIWTSPHGDSSQWNTAYNERGSQIAGSGLTWDGSQLVLTATTGGSLWSQSGSNIYYDTGFVGIGTSNPSYALDVSGVTRIYDSLIISEGSSSGSRIKFEDEVNTDIYWLGVNNILNSFNLYDETNTHTPFEYRQDIGFTFNLRNDTSTEFRIKTSGGTEVFEVGGNAGLNGEYVKVTAQRFNLFGIPVSSTDTEVIVRASNTELKTRTLNSSIWGITSGDTINWDAAYDERGSQIAGSGLTWDGSQLVLTATTGGSLWSENGTDIYYDSGGVIIGTSGYTGSTVALYIDGVTKITNQLILSNSTTSHIAGLDSSGNTQQLLTYNSSNNYLILNDSVSPVAKTLIYGTNGNIVVTVNGTDSVGINQFTPSYNLDVNGSFRTTGNLYANSNIVIGDAQFLKSASSGGGIRFNGDDTIRIYDSGVTEWFRIDNGLQKVGIGLTNPTTTLSVFGTITTNSGGTSDQWYEAYNQRGSVIAGNNLTWNGSQLDVTGISAGGGNVSGNGVTNQVAYWGGTDTITGSTTFVWDGSQLGIGTGSPISTLTVSGSIHSTQDIEISTASNGLILKSPNGTRYRVTVDNDGSLVTTQI